MYTGIIQDAQFVGPGSYLRRKADQYGLDKQHNWGRIWRITYEGMAPDRTPPRMYSETSAQLVSHLEHPNGWWRDTAQKLLVLKQDRSVAPALKTMARTSSNQLARIHALWTLEGLSSLDAVLARELMKSPDPQIRIQAIRASESLYKGIKGDKSFAADYRAMVKDPDPNVVIQAMLTLNLQRVPQSTELIRVTRDASTVRGVKEISTQLLAPGRALGQPASNDSGMGYLNLTSNERRTLMAGEAAFKELCFSCHGSDGKGTPVAGAPAGTTMAPPLAGSARVLGHRDYVIKVLLNGLSGPLDGKEYNGGAVMVPMGANTDEWISDVANYVRNAFGNNGRPYITPAQVAAVRKTVARKTPWTLAELQATTPSLLANVSEWTLTASHNAGAAGNIVTGAVRWDTGEVQQPGMWFQIELPQPATIVELQLDATPPGGRGNAGLAGFGGLGVTTPTGGPATGGRAAGGPTALGGLNPQARGGAGGGGTGAAPGAPAGARGAAGGAGAGGRGGRGGGPPATGPVTYTVQTSMDGTTWGPPLAQGTGDTPTTIVTLRPVQAKFIRVTDTGKAANGEFWAIQQVRLYQPGLGK